MEDFEDKSIKESLDLIRMDMEVLQLSIDSLQAQFKLLKILFESIDNKINELE